VWILLQRQSLVVLSYITSKTILKKYLTQVQQDSIFNWSINKYLQFLEHFICSKDRKKYSQKKDIILKPIECCHFFGIQKAQTVCKYIYVLIDYQFYVKVKCTAIIDSELWIKFVYHHLFIY